MVSERRFVIETDDDYFWFVASDYNWEVASDKVWVRCVKTNELEAVFNKWGSVRVKR